MIICSHTIYKAEGFHVQKITLPACSTCTAPDCLTSTPTFFVNGVKYTGKKDFQSWREILDRALAAGGQYPGAGADRP
jgi:hypothetical protein